MSYRNLIQNLQSRHLLFFMSKLFIWVALLALCCDGKEKPKDEPSSVQYEDHNTNKRSPQLYSFGLGKKSMAGDPDEYEVPTYQEVEDDEDFDRQMGVKRDGNFERYSFGLGKKALQPSRFAFGLGKRRDSPTSRFSFGLGKRMEQRYAFGLGKREPGRYAFGLGKRETSDELEEYIKRRFSFGLGKRAVDPRFAFGLGRRKKSDATYMI